MSVRLIAISPFENPDARLVLALARAGALAVLDLGRDERLAREALGKLARGGRRGLGVRIPEGVTWDPAELPPCVDTVVLVAGADVARFRPRRVIVQVTSVAEARAAEAAGADELIAKGAESGGRVGGETTFVLVQHLAEQTALPIHVQGGVGLHTAAACVVGGAAGLVLDSQLALVRESTLPEAVKAAVRAMDGSETTVLGDHRLYTRPDLPIARLAAATAADVVPRLGALDLEKSFLPAGQDAAFARPLADRFRTAGGVTHAIAGAVDEHLRLAAEHEPLAPGSALARDHGVRFPIAQGPMTRVSDRAAFADAVSRGGGLPFLALSLMRGDEVRALLEETASILGDRTWGVGVLGFVPEDLREEQLAVVRDLRPKVALIAGGRPSQARPLEAQGTATYLHVPSPGLLDLFLADGARRFVFEGRECGGHVGPRTSFALWETQIERLLAHPDVANVHVIFAGGIHEARSSAMVAAMAAPLAARGAKVGVLMGTAYLFTEEAVSTGAIQPRFQREAVGCEATVLLETAPGHATRCVETDFVRAFTEEKRRLESEGKAPEEVWAALEQLNLGRLRIAAKGLRREGDRIVQVDEEAQAREGMFMIGQVAALRREVVSIEALHRDVSEGATALLASGGKPADETPEPDAPADVAVIGMACIFPDAPDRHTFWANILAGKNSVTEVPKERWDTDVYYDPNAAGGERSRSKWGGFLPAIPFDPLAYGIPPRSIIAIEPVQLLALEVAKRALEDAGYGESAGAREPGSPAVTTPARRFDRERTSVIFGAEAGTELSSAYGFRAMYPQYAGPIPPALDDHLPVLTEDSFPGILANVIAGRIANRLDLGGVNYTVDAACAASLAALDLAVKELTSGTSDMVLCGGADVHNSINDYLLFSSVHALSPTGACRTFDADADGIVLGEGVACVVLKRLADAERDGDRIYAVVKGIAGGSDGRSLGLTAPRKEGQVRALDRAYRAACMSPAEVGLVEAHGTGTVVGDRTELATLTEVFVAAGAKPASVALGSVKSQIGHTKCAAGMAGLIKMALALHHRVLPPTLHIKRTNAAYDPETSPFTFGDVARPWPRENRAAAVSAFGFGGTNFHAVLAAYEGADGPASGLPTWPAELFLFHAPDRAGALRQLDRLEAVLASGAAHRLADLSRSVTERRRRGDGPVQLAIVATSREDLRDKIRRARSFAPEPGIFVRREGTGGRVAFLFSGQGSQRPGMLADVFIAFPSLQRFLALGERWVSRMFPPLVCTREARAAQAAALTDTRVAQPALGVVELALADLLRSLGVRPDMLAGHSYGELAALASAGAIPETELLGLSEARGQLILAAAGDDPGTMAAVSAAPDAIAHHLAGLDRVVVANHNAPDQTVISGPTAGVREAVSRLEAADITARPIPVACAFHSEVVAGAQSTFGARLAEASISPPRHTVYSNATAAAYPADAADVRRMLAEHVARPVRFVEQIEAMYEAGARTFIEVGPGRVLTGLTGRILGQRPHLAVACDQAGEPGMKQLLSALAELATSGVALDVAPLYAGRDARSLDLDQAPAARLSPSTWLVDGHLARPLTGELPPGALRPVLAPLVTQAPAAVDRETAVLEYLRTTREIVEAQRQVMLGFLGEGAPARPLLSASSSHAAAAPLPSFSPPGMTQGPANAPRLSQGGASGPASARSPHGPPSAAPRSSTPSMRGGQPSTPSIPAGRPSSPPMSIAPRAARLPSESLEWMRDIGAGAGAPPVIQQSIQDALVEIVSERTGYPTEMLDLDLNLEAELSIDSIKRIEILGTLGQRLGFMNDLGEGRDKAIEKLATMKTLREIVAWLEARQRGGAAAPALSTPPPASSTATSPPPSPPPPSIDAPRSSVRDVRQAPRVHPGIQRFVPVVVDAPCAPRAGALAGASFVIAPDAAGIALEVIALLQASGATARLDDGTSLDGATGLVDLTGFAPDAAPAIDPTKGLFERARALVLAKGRAVLAVTHLGAPFGPEQPNARSGAAGLVRTLAKEAPGLRARCLALDPREPAARLAEHVVAELAIEGDEREVAHVNGDRKALAIVPADRADQADRAATETSAAPLGLDESSVILVTGGARGITATIAIALARRFRCRLELCGRSPLPEAAEDPDLAGAADLPALRRLIIAQKKAREPAAIEALASKVLAAREIRATLDAIAAAGATAGYHAVDVRDGAAFGALIDQLLVRHGHLDGVVHGAGVLEDRLLEQKTRTSFDRVFDTKVTAARVLAERLARGTRLVAFFGSVSGVFGNRGQIDYSAANDALDKLAWSLRERITGKVVSIDWGPWAGAGMISPELAREYERRGVGLVDPVLGAESFLDEILGPGSAPQVVLMNAALTVMDERAAAPEPTRRAPVTADG